MTETPLPSAVARRWVTATAALGVLAASLWLLNGIVAGASPREVAAALRAIPLRSACGAAALVVLSYIALLIGEMAALASIGVGQPLRRVALVTLQANAFTRALGIAPGATAPFRYRLYSAGGVDGPDIARIVSFVRRTDWVGAGTVAGAALALGWIHPAVLWRLVGLLLLGVVVATAVMARVRPGRVPTAVPEGQGAQDAPYSQEAPGIPVDARWRPVAMQFLVGTLEIAASAAALYALLPGRPSVGAGVLVGVFAAARLLALASRVPQGLVVFEVALFSLLPVSLEPATLLGAVAGFRLLAFGGPLMVALAVLAGIEGHQRRSAVGSVFATAGAGVSAATPIAMAGAAFVAGALLLFNGALPLPETAGWGVRVPLPVLEASHFIGSVFGAGLLILSWGLARRMDGAHHLALALLLGAIALGLVLGDHLWSSAFFLILAAGLWAARREFFRPSALTREPLSPEWTVGVAAVLVGTLWLGVWAYRDVTLSGELWWRFAFSADAPRFLRGSVGAAGVLIAFGTARLLRGSDPPSMTRAGERLPGAAEAVIRASPRPGAQLAFLGDKQLLMAKSERALLMYGVEGRSWVSLGDPVGDPDDFQDLIWMFRSRTFRHGGWPVFYQVTPAYLPLYIDAGLGLLKLGEEAVVDVGGFSLEGGARAGMRKTVRKAEKEGATFEILEGEDVRTEMNRLAEISDAWLVDKNAKEKSFSLGSFSREYMAHFSVAVAKVDGRVVAFANVLQGGDGREFSLDLMRYDPATSPSGVMQYVFAQALLWGKERGFTRFSMGMAPLSGLESGPLAPLSARLGALVFRHGEHFYNFQGLRAYKEKFDPVWEPRYLASPGGLALPRIVGNIATLVSGGARGLIGR